ncbi:MAG: TatD family hydrolase [Bacteroidia bacterium]|nr:MAG: TatD family hydrolase [Bacteroidia bacterium]
MTFIDTHTHLFDEQFQKDIDIVIQNAKNANLKACFLPNVDEQTIPAMMSLAQKYPHFCYPMLGLHPCSVKENYQEVLDNMFALFQKYTFWGIGETGLDYYWDKTYIHQQKNALIIQAEWAKEKHLPLILHTRDAMYDTIQIIKSCQNGNLKGIFHCFSGSYEQAKEILKLGFLLGIGGVVTYKNTKLPETLSKIPLEFIVLETDAPYLSPVPYRGKRNESAYIPIIAQKLSEIYSLSVQEIAEITTHNAQKLFNLI